LFHLLSGVSVCLSSAKQISRPIDLIKKIIFIKNILFIL
jgi:hypothetical protein